MSQREQRRRSGRGVARVLLATVCGIAACAEREPTAAVAAPPAAFFLGGSAGSPLPVVLGATAGGRRVEVTDGALLFDHLAPGTGRVVLRESVRITDPGQSPTVTTSETAARFQRGGDTVQVLHANGSRATYLLENGDQRLRTIAVSGCTAPSGGACTGELLVLLFERRPAP